MHLIRSAAGSLMIARERGPGNINTTVNLQLNDPHGFLFTRKIRHV